MILQPAQGCEGFRVYGFGILKLKSNGFRNSGPRPFRRFQDSKRGPRAPPFNPNVEALIIRIGFWGPLGIIRNPKK